jgi:hypothetical protein
MPGRGIQPISRYRRLVPGLLQNSGSAQFGVRVVIKTQPDGVHA